MKPLHIILDLDDTLMHSGDYELERALGPAESRLGQYHMYARPGARRFLDVLAKDARFQLGVWTSASRDYAEHVIDWLMPGVAPAVFFSREHLVRPRFHAAIADGWGHGVAGEAPHPVKDLLKIARRGFDLKRTVAIDDNPRFFIRQYSNLIRVPAWQGQAETGQLFTGLMAYLEDLARLENVRPTEKRGWLHRYVPGFAQGPDPLSQVPVQSPSL